MSDEPLREPGPIAAAMFFAAIAANAIGLDRVLALVLSARSVRAFQVSVVFAGKIVREKPVLGAPGARLVSYAFLGQEALADLGHLLIAVAAFFYVRRSLPRPFALDRATAVLTAKIAAALAAAFAVAGVTAGLIAARVGGGAPLRTFIDRLDVALLADRWGLLLALGGFLFTAPLAEELVFRGILYRTFRTRLDTASSVILQATLFALCHVTSGFDAWVIAIPYAWGIAAAVLFERTRSLGAAVLLHAAGNAAGLLLIAVAMSSPAEIYAALGGR